MIRRMRPGDHLMLVELNERFVECLRGRLKTDPRWQAVASRVSLFSGSLEDLPRDKNYDVVVSPSPSTISSPTSSAGYWPIWSPGSSRTAR